MKQLRSTIVVAVVVLLTGVLSAGAWAQVDFRGTNNIVLVAKNGPGFRSIRAALASITDASEHNPYLVYVAPGVYQEKVVMKDYVDIEGAGEHLTRIVSRGPRTLVGADAGLQSLSVECLGTDYCTAIDNQGDLRANAVSIRASARSATGVATCCGNLTLEEVTLDIQPTPQPYQCRGNGVLSRCMRGCTPFLRLDEVSLLVANDECTNTGVYVTDDFEIHDSTIVVEGSPGSISVWSFGHSGHLDHVSVASDSWALGSSGHLDVRHSDIHGAIATGFGETIGIAHSELSEPILGDTVSCFSTCGPDMRPLDERCRTISD